MGYGLLCLAGAVCLFFSALISDRAADRVLLCLSGAIVLACGVAILVMARNQKRWMERRKAEKEGR